MGAAVDHGVSAEIMLEPFVERRILRVWRQVSLEQQTHRVAFDAEQGLDADEHVAKLQARNDRLARRRRGEARAVLAQIAPRRLHLRHKKIWCGQERHRSPLRWPPRFVKRQILFQALRHHVRPRDGRAERRGHILAKDLSNMIYATAGELFPRHLLQVLDDALAGVPVPDGKVAHVVPGLLERGEDVLQRLGDV